MSELYRVGAMSMRVIEEDDLEKLSDHRNEQETWSNLTSPLPIWKHNQKRWLESLGRSDFYFMTVHGRKDVGLLRVTDVDWTNRTACVGLDIFKPYRGRGLAKSAFHLVVNYCFNVLNMHRLWLLVLETNSIAVKVYQSQGFKIEGVMRKHIYRDGEYLNYLLMGLLEEEYENPTIQR